MSDLLGVLHEKGMEIQESKITPSALAEMLQMIKDGTISGKIGKIILPEVVETGKMPSQVVKERGMERIADRRTIEVVVDEVFIENSKAVEDALTDCNAVNYLIGQVMRKTGGKGDPKLVNEVVRQKLERRKERELDTLHG